MLASGDRATVCLTGGNAHADGLAQGLATQLPAQMERSNADHGIYVALWYRCHAFRYPRADVLQTMWDLTTLRPWGNIAVEALDLGLPEGCGVRRRDEAQRRGRRVMPYGAVPQPTS